MAYLRLVIRAGSLQEEDDQQGLAHFVEHMAFNGSANFDFGEIKNPPGFQRLSELPNLTAAMISRGWAETRIQKVMGETWLPLLTGVWGG